jgi:hypothetical protein
MRNKIKLLTPLDFNYSDETIEGMSGSLEFSKLCENSTAQKIARELIGK